MNTSFCGRQAGLHPVVIALFLSVVIGALTIIASPAEAQSPAPLGKLSLTLAPSSLPADGNTYRALYVQLWGRDSTPIQSPEPVRVFLTSTDPDVAVLPDEVVIGPGSSYVAVPVAVSQLPGEVRLIAVAVGYADADIALTTTSSLGSQPPYRLAVSALPPVVYPGQPGLLSVALVDDAGIPYLAPSDIAVVLTSSASESIDLPRTVVIPAGDYVAITQWIPRKSDDVSILAQAEAIQSGTAWVSVSELVEQGEPSILEAYLLVPSMPARDVERQAIVLQALDKNRVPVDFPCTDIFVTSSDPRVLVVTAPAPPSQCEATRSYLTYGVRSTDRPGEATVTAGAVGMVSASVKMPTYGVLETRLSLQQAPSTPLGTDLVPSTITVQLIDQSGRPVVFHGGHTVTILSHGAKLPTTVKIPAGRSFVTLNLDRDSVEKQVTLAAAAPGVEGASLAFEVERHELEVALDVPVLIAGTEAEVTAIVTADGEPVANAEVVWESAGLLGEPLLMSTDENGLATLVIRPSEVSTNLSIRASVSYAGFQGSTVAEDATVSPSVEVGDDGPSRGPFLLIFAAVCMILAGYMAYTSGLHVKASNSRFVRALLGSRPLQ
ncbi:MAG: hypothetical protein J4N99_06295 [Chloroflexi bacterium]|nr:hypothetical protein [Chloroflexota bacterium]